MLRPTVLPQEKGHYSVINPMDSVWQLLDSNMPLITWGFSEEGFRAHNTAREH